MLKPVELYEQQIIALSSGQFASTADIWRMFTATKEGDLNTVRQLVLNCSGLATYEYNYTPPIHFAVREGHLNIVEFLLDYWSDPAYRTYSFRDSLLTMALDRQFDSIADLLRNRLYQDFSIRDNLDQILAAASEGDLDQLKLLIGGRADLINSANETGETALHKAVEAGHLDIITFLLDRGANVDAVRTDGIRPINCAMKTRNRTEMNAGFLAGLLYANGAEYNIYIAAFLGDAEYVRNALSKDPSLANFEDSSHARPITAATVRNDIEMVQLLLNSGADPSLPENGAPLGQSLWHAVYQKNYELAQLLLENGANPNTAPESSGSALFQARGDQLLTKLLLEYGAEDISGDINEFQNYVGDNSLDQVSQILSANPQMDLDKSFCFEGILAGPANNGNKEMLDLLLSYGARVPKISKWGRYYYFKHYEIAKHLLERGMDANHMNWHQTTLLHDMAHEGEIEKAELLIEHGADINAVDEEYNSTPLGIASRWGNSEMVTFLLKSGADPNAAGAKWATPLAWSRLKSHEEIENKLLSHGAAG